MIEISHTDGTEAFNWIFLVEFIGDMSPGMEIGVYENWMDPSGMIGRERLLRHFDCWVGMEYIE